MSKRVFFKSIMGMVFFILTILVITACGSHPGNTGGSGKVLTFASPDYTTINPVLNTHDELPDIIFSGLMRYDEAGNPVPDLAEGYDFNPASLTYTFHLKQGVTWHDGEPFTADDVKFTLDKLAHDQELLASITDNYKEIKEVTVVDPYTVNVTLMKPNAAMLNYLTIGILPKHLLDGKNMMTDSFNRHPIGTGRYRFVSWDKGQSIIVEKNTSYYGKIPNIDRIIFKIIPDESAKAAQVKAGRIDLAWLNAQNAEAFRKDESFTVYDFKTADYRAIAPNFQAPFWRKNSALVSILGYALDKKGIVGSVLTGQGQAAYSPLQMNAAYNDPDVIRRDYDLSTFRKLVEEQGWMLGHDGIYEKDGEKLSFTVDVREFEKERIDIANVAASQFKKAGVDMKVHIVPTLDWKHIEAFLIGNAAPFDPDNGTYDLFHSNGSGNYTHYVNADVDHWLEIARSAYDQGERKAAYNQFQIVWAQHPAYIMIAYLDGNYVASKRLEGIDAGKRILGHHATGIFRNVEDWDIAQ